MKKFGLAILLVNLLLVIPINEAQSTEILLDADSQQTGRNLDTTPLITQYGTISYNGWIEEGSLQPWITGWEFTHDVVYSPSRPYSEFIFDFDVDSISFNFGGGIQGGIYAEALDINGDVVDTFHTLEMSAASQPGILSGSGIRSFTFIDGRMGGYSEVDNVLITTSVVPEPISSILFVTGGTILGFRRFRKKVTDK